MTTGPRFFVIFFYIVQRENAHKKTDQQLKVFVNFVYISIKNISSRK